jgi:hypothetical protein
MRDERIKHDIGREHRAMFADIQKSGANIRARLRLNRRQCT